MSRIRATLAGLTASLVLAAGCAGKKSAAAPPNAPATAPTVQVSIDNFSFTPAELTIRAGDTVMWVNHDDVPHTVVSRKPDKTLRSDALDTDETYKHTFAAVGTYEYFCSVHPHMTGKVIVQSAERKN